MRAPGHRAALRRDGLGSGRDMILFSAFGGGQEDSPHERGPGLRVYRRSLIRTPPHPSDSLVRARTLFCASLKEGFNLGDAER